MHDFPIRSVCLVVSSLLLTLLASCSTTGSSEIVPTGASPKSLSPASPAGQNPALLAQLDSCMKERTLIGGGVGAAIGGAIGAILGRQEDQEEKRKGRNSHQSATKGAVGAGAGAALGATIAWQTAYKACIEKLNLATASARQTEDYSRTARRYGYTGRDTLLKIESIGMPAQIVAGNTMVADLTYALLTPNASEAEVQVQRAFRCGSTDIPVAREIYRQAPGMVVSTGRILIPSADQRVGNQQCSMNVVIVAGGQRDEVTREFLITTR